MFRNSGLRSHSILELAMSERKDGEGLKEPGGPFSLLNQAPVSTTDLQSHSGRLKMEMNRLRGKYSSFPLFKSDSDYSRKYVRPSFTFPEKNGWKEVPNPT